MAVIIDGSAQAKIDRLNDSVAPIDNGDEIQYFNQFFFPIDGLNQYRPYNINPIAHEPNTATIVLIAKAKSEKQAQESDAGSYFDDFTRTIEAADLSAAPGDYIPILGPKEGGSGGLGINYYGIFKNFSLMSVSESSDEIVKVSFNFGNRWNAFFFGEKPKVYVYNGYFLDAKNYPYYEEFMRAYTDFLAGGKCVENEFSLYMSYDGKIVKGWMLGINISDDSSDEYLKKFSFKLLIEDESFYRQNYDYDSDGSFLGSSIGSFSNRHLIPGINRTKPGRD